MPKKIVSFNKSFVYTMQNVNFVWIKGTVSVLSSEPACKDGMPTSLGYTFKFFPVKYEFDINVYDFKKGLFSNVVSTSEKNTGIIRIKECLV